MERFRILIFILTLLTAGACCGPGSRVVLLDSGRPAAVVVATRAGELVLDRPNTAAEIGADATRPAEIREVSAAELEEHYGRLLETRPEKPVSFLLYFKTGSLKLVDQSRKIIPEIVRTIQQREPCDVGIYGYADRVGSRSSNERLSRRRARKVFQLLKQAGAELNNVDLQFYGEQVLLVPTPDGVAEEKNRRVEVQVR